jgi:hypothetical protein
MSGASGASTRNQSAAQHYMPDLRPVRQRQVQHRNNSEHEHACRDDLKRVFCIPVPIHKKRKKKLRREINKKPTNKTEE